MCCLVASLFAFGPRAAILVWWLLEPIRWNAAFDTFIWPLLGFVAAPWTTLMYVVVAPAGINGFDVVWLGLAVMMDIASWFGGAYTNRGRMPGYPPGAAPQG
jgi:hypothetical protein